MKNMPPGLRKFALVAHIVSSVGWLGAVAAFMALSVVGLTSMDSLMVRSSYLAMEQISRFVIVPLSLASLFTGLVQALGSPWGIFRHYWVLIKFLLTLLATLILLTHTQAINYMGAMAAKTILSSTDFRQLRIQLVANAGAALVVLLVNTVLSVYKPKGMTRYGQRKIREEKSELPG